MSVNIRDYVSNDHIESIGEIARGQSAIIQALSLDNSDLERQNGKLQEEIERLNNIIKEVREYIINIPDDEFVESEHFTELLEILDKVNNV